MANLRVQRGDRAGCQDSLAGRTLIYAEMMREVDGLCEGAFPNRILFCCNICCNQLSWLVWPIAVYWPSPPAPER